VIHLKYDKLKNGTKASNLEIAISPITISSDGFKHEKKAKPAILNWLLLPK